MKSKFLWRCLAALLLVFSCFVRAEIESWTPPEDKWDWLQTKKGEWIKGEIIALYDKRVEFDSDEFGLVKVKWKKIRYLRTAEPRSIRLRSGEVLTGRVLLDGKELKLAETGEIIRRGKVVSMASSGESEWDYWDGDVELGGDIRSGNTDEENYSLAIGAKRRTPITKLEFSYRGVYGTTSDEEIENNHRFTTSLDYFYSKKIFIRPVNFEFYRDPFQNIAARYSYSAQIGRYFVDNSDYYWEASIGPGYQLTEFADVESGEDDSIGTEIFELDTTFEWDITSDIEYELLYTARWVNTDSGGMLHHLETGFEFDITGELEFAVKYIVDRIQEPTPDENGEEPEATDRRLILGIVYEF